MLFRRLLMLCLLIPCLVVAQNWSLKPGQGYGPVRLGQGLSEAEKALGAPVQSVASQSDPESSLKTYSRGVTLLVNGKRKVIGVTVFEAGARSAEGLGVGSSQGQVQKVLGPGLVRGPGNVAYPGLGIGFAYDDSGKAERVFIFAVEAQSALQGDRQVVAGLRCGGLKLGMALAQVEAAWGKAVTQQGKDHRWPDRGVGLLVEGGKVLAITLTTGDYITARGVKMGSSRAEVLAEFGKPSQGNDSTLMYPTRGIAFYLAGDTVSTVQVFAPMK